MADLFDKTEVAQLYRRLLLDKNILRFNVSMEEAVAVDVVERGGDLMDDVSDLLVRERIVVQFAHLHHAVQIHVEQLEHHIERVLVTYHFKALNYIRMLQPDHGLNLGVSHRRLPGRELALKGLQRVYFLSLLVGDLIDDTEAALAERFQHPESFY